MMKMQMQMNVGVDVDVDEALGKVPVNSVVCRLMTFSYLIFDIILARLCSVSFPLKYLQTSLMLQEAQKLESLISFVCIYLQSVNVKTQSSICWFFGRCGVVIRKMLPDISVMYCRITEKLRVPLQIVYAITLCLRVFRPFNEASLKLLWK